MSSGTRTIEVGYLARVEGEGGLRIRLKGQTVEEVELNIFEPPRFFEAMLRGRDFLEAPDITSRICGICPIAYQSSAAAAMEDALGVRTTPEIQRLRRLIYCGEWIESHSLHVFLLHAPDFLGCPSVVELARSHPRIVERGLRLKKVGNDLMALIGGREIHPINYRVGGFYRAPSRREVSALSGRLAEACDIAEETVRWVAGFDFPDFERDYELVCLRASGPEYPIEEGTFVSNRGLAVTAREYEDWFVEQQVPHSTALHSSLKGRGEYLTGPLARLNLNFDRLPPRARAAADAVGFTVPCLNPFRLIIVRALEILCACEEALRLIAGYVPPEPPSVPVPPRAAVGCGATEAPRGVLYHRYRLDDNGLIQEAKIVPPTSQNQPSIETDLRRFVERHLALPRQELSMRCEQVVRNHDPCISCATHFLDVRFEEAP